MFTYFIYNTVLITAGAFAYIAEKGNTKRLRYFCRWMVFLALFIPAALRYGTGTDYFNYIDIFDNIEKSFKELGWLTVNRFVKKMGWSYQGIFVIAAALIYYPIAFHLKREHYCLAVILYILLTFYFKSYNILRQAIATSFLISTLYYLENKKRIPALIYFILACLFHISAILFIPLYMLKVIKFKNNIFPLIIEFGGVGFLLVFNAFKIILTILAMVGSSYARYANIPKYIKKTSVGSGLGILLAIIPVLIVIFNTKRIVKEDKYRSFYVTLSIIYSFSYILAAQFIILGRLRDLLIFIPLIVTGYGIETCGKYRKLVLCGLLSLFLLTFEINIKKQNRNAYTNFTYPYYSIWDIEEYKMDKIRNFE